MLSQTLAIGAGVVGRRLVSVFVVADDDEHGGILSG
jgi:hypothetical protein